MLTPIVTALMFGNCLAGTWSLPFAAALAALQLPAQVKPQAQVLIDPPSPPTQLFGRAGGPDRPHQVARQSKEESYELPSAA